MEKDKTIKQCKHCIKEIDVMATRCPHCQGKNYVWTTRKKVVAVCFGIFLLIAFSGVFSNNSSNSNSSSTTYTPTPSLSVGDEGYLKAGGESVMVSITKEILDETTKLSIAKDTEGLARMVIDGDILLVDSGTKARVIDTEMFSRKVRILDGKYYGMSGWVPVEFVVK